MTTEEKLRILKEASVFVAGDMVLEKHVENEIGFVEDGGIGIQIINGSKKDDAQSCNTRKKKTEAQIVEATFRYRWAESRENQIRVIYLYQALLKAKWIDADTKPDAFAMLFAGKPCDVHVKWTGKKSFLAYLFKTICERQYVVMPEGLENKIWLIVQSHFIDDSSRLFVNLNKEKKPKLRAGAIEQVADILNPASGLVEIELDDDD